MTSPFRLRLPATSANIGPGFDAVGLALNLFLDVEATLATDGQARDSIQASGRNADLCSRLDGNLILSTYRELAPDAPVLHLKIANEIPIGVGLGSSAAALLAGVHLASHFGSLSLTPQQILEEACAREGHPDNVAACHLGGFTVSSMRGRQVTAASVASGLPGRILVALPSATLSTEKARGLLPSTYTRADAVANLQATALLVAAFALKKPELLASATRDRMHQPYRAAACPLLTALLPLAGLHGIYSVTLSGAGPAVLLITDLATSTAEMMRLIGREANHLELELVEAAICPPSG